MLKRGLFNPSEITTINMTSSKGTRKVHSIMATNKNQLAQFMVRDLACICVFGIDKKWDQSVNVKWTGECMARYLQPADTEFVRETMLSK